MPVMGWWASAPASSDWSSRLGSPDIVLNTFAYTTVYVYAYPCMCIYVYVDICICVCKLTCICLFFSLFVFVDWGGRGGALVGWLA